MKSEMKIVRWNQDPVMEFYFSTKVKKAKAKFPMIFHPPYIQLSRVIMNKEHTVQIVDKNLEHLFMVVDEVSRY